MSIPWSQIAKLVPTILSLSQDLLQQTRKTERTNVVGLEARVSGLEENERKQAELVEKMAEQIVAMAEAGVRLRKQLRVLQIVATVSLLAAIGALVFVIR